MKTARAVSILGRAVRRPHRNPGESPTNHGANMRFMAIVKATKDSEAGVMPKAELIKAMGDFNEQMAKAGVMLAGEGLQPSSKGARVRFEKGKRTVIDAPFTETKELVAGFWLLQAKSKQEEIEIRQVFETSDFPADVFPAEEVAREDALRAELEKKQNK